MTKQEAIQRKKVIDRIKSEVNKYGIFGRGKDHKSQNCHNDLKSSLSNILVEYVEDNYTFKK